MSSNRKNKKSNKQTEDGAFHSKNINHDPQAESARAKFGKKTPASE
ncbi:MAG TPA: CPC_1213 family protein [Ruminiclostridium sp.]|nr:CPC_1213 family protein [Ruminiclostridium sp.]